MASKTYTNVVLSVIAILLAGLLFKGSFELVTSKVYAIDEKYKEFRVVATVNYEADKTVQEYIKFGWKPIAITQSQAENRSFPDLTILFAK